MSFPGIIGFVILGLAVGAQLWLRSYLFEHRRAVVLFAGLAIASAVLWKTWGIYEQWQIDPLARFYLPPHQSISYFLMYVGRRFLGPWVVAAIAGALGAFLAKQLNKRFEDRFFEEEEPFLFGLALFASGYPSFLFYIVFFFIAAALVTLISMVRGAGRASLYYLWLPVAIFAILVVEIFFNNNLLGKFNF